MFIESALGFWGIMLIVFGTLKALNIISVGSMMIGAAVTTTITVLLLVVGIAAEIVEGRR